MTAPFYGALMIDLQFSNVWRGHPFSASPRAYVAPPAGGGSGTPDVPATNAVLVSAPGEAPEVDLNFVDVFAGYYLRIQRTTAAGDYSSPTLDITHQVTYQEVGAEDISASALQASGYTAPSGFYEQRYRWERDDGQVGAWSTVTDTVISWNAVFNPAMSNSYANFTPDNRTVEEDVIGNAAVTSLVGTALSNGTGYFEATLVARNNDGTGSEPSYAHMAVGVAKSTFAYGTLGQSVANNTNSIGLRDDGNWWAQNVLQTQQSSILVGDTVGALVHLTTRTVWLRDKNGWIGGTPVIDANGDIDPSSTGGIAMDGTEALHPGVTGTGYGTEIRFNGGQDPFVLGALPDNVEGGWG